MRFAALLNVLCCAIVTSIILELWIRAKRTGGATDASKGEAMTACFGFIFFVLTSIIQSFYILGK